MTSEQTLQMHHDGFDRTAYFKAPQAPRALLVLLHPVGGAGIGMAESGGWCTEDYAVLAPNALPLWSDKPGSPRTNPSVWSSASGVKGILRRESGVPFDDVGFIDACIEQVTAKLGHSLPLLLVGHSNGAAMGFRLLVESRHRARVVAASLMAATWGCAKSDLHTAMLYANGDSDPIRPEQGHPGVPLPWFVLPQDPVEMTVSQCTQALGADETLWQRLDSVPAVEVRTNVSGRARLTVMRLRRHGHAWPVGQSIDAQQAARLGPCNADINLTGRSLKFFDQELANRAV